MVPAGPALGLLEIGSIARGLAVADAMVKQAPVRLLDSHPVSPGKYMVLVSGQVAEVEEALSAGKARCGSWLIDELYLPQADAQIIPTLVGSQGRGPLGALGILETLTISATLLGADRAAKTADVRLVELELARGLGGKAFFIMTGAQSDVEAALAAGAEVARSQLVEQVLIAAPHDDLLPKVRR